MNAITLTLDESVSRAIPTSTSGGNRQPGMQLNPYAVFFSLTTFLALATAHECHSIFYLPSLLYGIVYWDWWGCVAAVLWAVGQRDMQNVSPRAIAVYAAAAPSLALIHLLLLGSLGFTNPQWQAHHTALAVWWELVQINRVGVELLIYGCVVGTIGLIQSQIRAQRDALKASELQRQLSMAQLQALQSQMEPHFLFNTLNAVTSLVDLGRNSEASETLGHLDTILRTTLRRRVPEKVPFTEELRIIESYLAIQQVRFSDRLRVSIHVSDEACSGLIPCFLLQPIVENAVKHGIAPMAKGGQIEAEVKRVEDSLWIQVRDTGAGFGLIDTKGHGIGMQNTRDRLVHFYPEDHRFAAGPMSGGGYEVTIQIPYERAGQ